MSTLAVMAPLSALLWLKRMLVNMVPPASGLRRRILGWDN